MKICFPAENLQGLDSEVYGHFGSAPGFVIVDTLSMGVEEINNGDLDHAHGMCQPLKALGNHQVDAVAVSGIGMGALVGLQSRGMKVYRAVQGTVRRNLDMIQSQELQEFHPGFTCAGHEAGGCCH